MVKYMKCLVRGTKWHTQRQKEPGEESRLPPGAVRFSMPCPHAGKISILARHVKAKMAENAGKCGASETGGGKGRAGSPLPGTDRGGGKAALARPLQDLSALRLRSVNAKRRGVRNGVPLWQANVPRLARSWPELRLTCRGGRRRIDPCHGSAESNTKGPSVTS